MPSSVERDGLVLEVDEVVAALLGALGPLLEAGHEPGEREVEVRRLLGLAADDQRRPRLVDEDVVDLVDDREAALALDPLVELDDHVVAQVVEPELVVRAVGHVGGVGLAPGDRPQVDQPLVVGRVAGLEHERGVVGDHPEADPEEVEDRAHPLRVAPGQVVVDGDDVDAAAGHRVEDARRAARQGLALAGLHLGDLALVEDGAADQLDVEVAHPERPLARPRGSSRRPRAGPRRAPSGACRCRACGVPSPSSRRRSRSGWVSSSSEGGSSTATSRISLADLGELRADLVVATGPRIRARGALISSTRGSRRRISRSFESTNLEKKRMGRLSIRVNPPKPGSRSVRRRRFQKPEP